MLVVYFLSNRARVLCGDASHSRKQELPMTNLSLFTILRARARCRLLVRKAERRLRSPARHLTLIRRDLRRVLRQPWCAASVRFRALSLLDSTKRPRLERADATLVALERDARLLDGTQAIRRPARPSEPAALPLAAARLDLLPSELVELLFSKFLQPFPDWTSCRLVHRAWDAAVRALDAVPSLWVGPTRELQLTPAVAGRSRARLLEELSLCKNYAPEDRPPPRFDEAEDEGDNDWTRVWFRDGVDAHDSWYIAQADDSRDHDLRYTLDVLDTWRGGESRLPPTREAAALRCLVTMSVRNFNRTLSWPATPNCRCLPPRWHKAVIRFAGSAWKVSVGIDTFRTVQFGCFLCRVPSTPELPDTGDFSIANSLSHIIRYRATFVAGGGPIDADAVQQHGSQRRCFDGSLASGTMDGTSCYSAEKLPVEIARFAIAPSRCCHLLLRLELEHIAYGLELV